MKFGPENQVNVHNYVSNRFCNFPLIARFRKHHVTISLILKNVRITDI